MTNPRHETPAAFARDVRRHLPPLPRRVRHAVADAVERHVAERLVEGRPAWLTIARLGPAEQVAQAVTEAWLEALDAGRNGADYLRLAARGALVPGGVAAVVLGGLMAANCVWVWRDLALTTPAASTWLVPWLVVLSVPVVLTVIAPMVAFYLGAGAIQALVRETSPGVRRRLAPRVAAALALLGTLGAGAGFVAEDAVLPVTNRATVDAVVVAMGLPHAAIRSPQELSFSEVRARLRAREAGDEPKALTAGGLELSPGEATKEDRRVLGMRVAVAAAIATSTWSGLAWGAAFGLSQIPAFASGGLALAAGYLLATALTQGGVPAPWATMAGSLLPLGLALAWLLGPTFGRLLTRAVPTRAQY